MGREIFTRSLYRMAKTSFDVGEKDVTAKSYSQAYSTGKLDPLVDPAGFGVIRLSLPRVEQISNGSKYRLTVGTPLPIETRVDTTGSMGDNVDIAMRVLPDAFESWTEVLEGYDIQVATGIFGDHKDRFPLCRPQFEMEAAKIVKQLTLMVPERQGHDTPEDPDIGIFGGAYLTRAYINRIGLKGYDFTVTDAPGRGMIDQKQLKRVFGQDVFEKVKQNGHKFNENNTIDLKDVWVDLLDRAHAFVLLVESSYKRFWIEHVGKDRVVVLPNTEVLPQVQAAIIGLTEGSLLPTDMSSFLKKVISNYSSREIDSICESLINIPIGAQAKLPNFGKCPKKGDIFVGKPDVWDDTNLWPEEQSEEQLVHSEENTDEPTEKDDWL